MAGKLIHWFHLQIDAWHDAPRHWLIREPRNGWRHDLIIVIMHNYKNIKLLYNCKMSEQ